MAHETTGFSRQSFEQGTAHVEKLMGARTMQAALEAQNEFLQQSYQLGIGQATRFGELCADVVKTTSTPFEGFVPIASK